MKETNEVIITTYASGELFPKIDLNILGRHFDGKYITKYEIVNDAGKEKLIVEFSPQKIIKQYKQKKED